jgi:hypothetical protein
MKFLKILLILVLLISCNGNQNKFINWADNLPENSSIENVKKSQPNYVIIDWEHPIKISDNEKMFEVTEIKNSYDALDMNYFLVFRNNKFQYRESKK